MDLIADLTRWGFTGLTASDANLVLALAHLRLYHPALALGRAQEALRDAFAVDISLKRLRNLARQYNLEAVDANRAEVAHSPTGPYSVIDFFKTEDARGVTIRGFCAHCLVIRDVGELKACTRCAFQVRRHVYYVRLPSAAPLTVAVQHGLRTCRSQPSQAHLRRFARRRLPASLSGDVRRFLPRADRPLLVFQSAGR